MHAAALLCLDVLQHLFDPRKSIYRPQQDTEEATKRSTNELQQPQTVVYAQHLYENYYVGNADSFLVTVQPRDQNHLYGTPELYAWQQRIA